MAVGPFDVAAIGGVPRLPQLPGDDGSPLLLNAVLPEDQPHQLGPLGVDGHAAVFHIIAQQRPSEDHSPLHLPGLTPLDPGGRLAALLLGDGAHDGKPQLRVRLQGVDGVVHKQDTHAQPSQLPGVGNGVQDVSGETADLLGDNQPEFPHVGVVNHPVEGCPLFGGCARDALVSVDLIQLPVRLAGDVLLEIALLRLKGIGLVILVGGDPAVGCYFDHVDYLQAQYHTEAQFLRMCGAVPLEDMRQEAQIPEKAKTDKAHSDDAGHGKVSCPSCFLLICDLTSGDVEYRWAAGAVRLGELDLRVRRFICADVPVGFQGFCYKVFKFAGNAGENPYKPAPVFSRRRRKSCCFP